MEYASAFLTPAQFTVLRGIYRHFDQSDPEVREATPSSSRSSPAQIVAGGDDNHLAMISLTIIVQIQTTRVFTLIHYGFIILFLCDKASGLRGFSVPALEAMLRVEGMMVGQED